MIKDRWLKDKIFLWQTIYESILEQLKIEGIKLRQPSKIKLSYQIRDVAKQIRDTRMKAGLKQVDLAKKLGVIQQYISKIETGRENCSIETLKQIADALNKNLTIKFQ
ncbi:MAG: helix-turn-helix transcriptional regulator [Candidatus Aureabacteria bacterium]|nr:helix-turn-helix transcriptional regulator [Candidatus Auribacterota bacterium]